MHTNGDTTIRLEEEPTEAPWEVIRGVWVLNTRSGIVRTEGLRRNITVDTRRITDTRSFTAVVARVNILTRRFGSPYVMRDFLDMLDGLDILHRFNRDTAQGIVRFAVTNRR